LTSIGKTNQCDITGHLLGLQQHPLSQIMHVECWNVYVNVATRNIDQMYRCVFQTNVNVQVHFVVTAVK